MSTMSPEGRRDLVAAMTERYQRSTPAERGRILDEFVALTGYHRKHAIRVLNASSGMPAVRRGRRSVYDEAVTEGLVVLWEASDRVCGKRLKALLPTLVPALERHGHLTLDPTVNRSQKGDRDAADWTPDRHGRWFAERVIAVKLEYGLSVDPAERDALERLLAGGGAELNCVAADTTSPTVAISSEASATVTDPFPILVAFSEPVTGFELEDLVVGNGSASELLQGNNATYTVTITPEASGTVTVDIAAGAAQDSAGNPSAAAAQFSITADLTPVPALPLAGAIVLALLLLIRGARQRAARV